MTSRMEFRNYRSSAQLVHCNIHRKRYNHFPQTTSQFQNNFGAAPENPVKSTDKLTNEVLYQCPVTHEKKYLI